MRIDLDHDDGGVLIAGSWVELDQFASTLRECLDDESGESVAGSLLTDDGVVTMTLRIERDDD